MMAAFLLEHWCIVFILCPAGPGKEGFSHEFDFHVLGTVVNGVTFSSHMVAKIGFKS